MIHKDIINYIFSFFFFALIVLTGCTTANAPTDGTSSQSMQRYNTLAPERVDVRGTIMDSRYFEGQVILEVENFAGGLDSRYRRAFVLVLPTVQILKPDGETISLHELRQGQDVAIMLRAGGRGTLVGVGEARKVWIEERL